MTDHIVTQHEHQIFEIILNRSEERNALNLPLLRELDAALDHAEALFNDGQARVLILRAEGRMFSSGIDLMNLSEYIALFGEHWQQNLFATTQLLQNILNKLERHSLPSIALLHGYCLGSGLELALACDFRVVAERTRLALPEARLGIIPDVGGTTRLTKLIGPSRAKEFILTGKPFDLADAERWGLVNYVVPAEELSAKAHELAGELKQSAPLAVAYGKRVINDLVDTHSGQQIEAWAQAQLFRTEDFLNGVQAMLTKSGPVDWQGK